MSVLVVGMSHNTAPVALLDRLTGAAGETAKLLAGVGESSHINERAALVTCNRVEVYAEVDRFHGSVEELSRSLCAMAGDDESVLAHLYVHYEDAAVSHLFHVAAGLDSMVVGEGQVLGQVRQALREGQESGSVGACLNPLFQQALRVGKRARAETGIDQTAPSLVSVALRDAAERLGTLHAARALVVGAGAMAGLALAELDRRDAGEVVVANRTRANAERLAGAYGARGVAMADLDQVLADADLVICCTGASGVVLDRERVAAARRARAGSLLVVDLAVPHDVAASVADLPGVTCVGLSALADRLEHTEVSAEVEAVREIVTEEVGAFLAARRAAGVTPTVVALRSMATQVVDDEVERLRGRLSDLSPEQTAEVERSVRRVAEKLLHTPTVRVKELASTADTVSYADALVELFSLDPGTVEAVTSPKQAGPEATGPEATGPEATGPEATRAEGRR